MKSVGGISGFRKNLRILCRVLIFGENFVHELRKLLKIIEIKVYKMTPCSFFNFFEKYERYYTSSIQLFPEEFFEGLFLLNFELWF